MANGRLVCTFTVDGLSVGIEAEAVQEVIGSYPLTPVPLAPPAVRGLMNYRGHILTAIDLRSRLHLRERPAGHLPMTVILYARSASAGLLVDEVGDILRVTEEAYEPTPRDMGPGGELVSGAYKLEYRLLLMLDVAATVNVSGG